MIQAFVLVQTDVGKAASVATEIARIPGVSSAEDVVGPYDVVVRAGAAAPDEFSALMDRIRQVPGITRVLTCRLPADAGATEQSRTTELSRATEKLSRATEK